MTWEATVLFRRFRKRHEDISRIYWTHQLGADAIQAALKDSSDDAKTTSIIGPSFRASRLPLNAGDMRLWIQTYASRTLLHTLLVCAANLELYLHEITVLHLAGRGYLNDHGQLTTAGEKLGRKILTRASLPEPLKAAQKLFGVSFGTHLVTWNRSYKLRCTLAHSAGAITARTQKDLPGLKQRPNEMLTITWPELRSSLASALQIAIMIDRNVATRNTRVEEAIRELREMQQAGELPPKKECLSVLYQRFGIRGLGEGANTIFARFYS